LRDLPRERREQSDGDRPQPLSAYTGLAALRDAATPQDLQASNRVVVHARKSAGRLEATKVQFKSAGKAKKQ
jgi:hypothetical protein